MITYPISKINLGLNVISKRDDGHHDIQTVFYPIPLKDVLEVTLMNEGFPSRDNCDIKISGFCLNGEERDNIVLRAYRLLSVDFSLPRVHVHLYKNIPTEAGLGGGSSDGTYMIKLLNEKFHLNMTNVEMEHYARKLGADCTFFIKSEASYAQGIGNILSSIQDLEERLRNYYIIIVKPNISVSTRDAFADIIPIKPYKSCNEIVQQDITTWRYELTNDFERTIFSKYPRLKEIKDHLYSLGAVYAQMSGSGSALYGIFDFMPIDVEKAFSSHFTFISQL